MDAANSAARDLGVNRVSICAQSFNDDELVRLTRKHTSADSLRLLDAAIAAGIENRHVDLMYGLRGQSLDDWRRTVEFTRVPAPDSRHVSAYKLLRLQVGVLDRTSAVPRPESEADDTTERLRAMHDLAVSVFAQAGFRQYTLTEFAKPGYESIYLTDTFGGVDILPFGPSSFGRCRHEVRHDPGLMMMYEDAQAWVGNRRTYALTPAEAFERDVILGLWLLRVDVGELASRAGVVPSAALDAALEDAAEHGWLDQSAGVDVTLSPDQRFGVGEAMASLARLDAAEWADVPNRPGTRGWHPSTASGPPRG